MNVSAARRPSRLWVTWLIAAASIVIVFGAALVLAPGWARAAFSLLLYAAADRIDGFGAEAMRYTALVHAVLGSVMMAWGVALLRVARGGFCRGESEAWTLISVCVLVWFVPDTAYSLWAGFWPNAVLNAGLAALLAVPLVATYRLFHPRDRT